MYEPQYGMPTQVLEGRENDFLALGYRREPPPILITPPPVKEEEKTQVFSPVVDNQPPGAGFIMVNSASLKELTERLGLSTAQAKELRDGRPYKTVEDLIAKIPGVSWTTLDSQISYQVNTLETPTV
jgi:DNA uptake protein ComE-like DNA-binding protein